jgi:hypothetical protein
LFAADTTNNVTHAILDGLGLIVGMMPHAMQRSEPERAAEPRFDRTHAAGHRHAERM